MHEQRRRDMLGIMAAAGTLAVLDLIDPPEPDAYAKACSAAYAEGQRDERERILAAIASVRIGHDKRLDALTKARSSASGQLRQLQRDYARYAADDDRERMAETIEAIGPKQEDLKSYDYQVDWMEAYISGLDAASEVVSLRR